MTGIRIFQIEFGTPEYDETVRLRDEVLRKPLGLSFTAEQLATEYDSLHLIATDLGGRLIACLVLVPVSESTIKMRQVAVRPDLQGRGVGKAIVLAAEALAADGGFQEMVLHARETATEFYRKLDYRTEGKQFEEVGIPHYKMRKTL
ncbi:MAG: GNAT family N-acetyltransferase [Saprospiraceae bacterium]